MLANIISTTREYLSAIPTEERHLRHPKVLAILREQGWFTIKTGENTLVLMNTKCSETLTFTLPFAIALVNAFKPVFADENDAKAAAEAAPKPPAPPVQPPSMKAPEPEQPPAPQPPPSKPKTLAERIESAQTFDDCYDLLSQVDSQLCKDGKVAPSTEDRLATMRALIGKMAKFANNFWYATLGDWMCHETALLQHWFSDSERSALAAMFSVRAKDADWVQVSDEVAGKIKTRYPAFKW